MSVRSTLANATRMNNGRDTESSDFPHNHIAGVGIPPAFRQGGSVATCSLGGTICQGLDAFGSIRAAPWLGPRPTARSRPTTSCRFTSEQRERLGTHQGDRLAELDQSLQLLFLFGP